MCKQSENFLTKKIDLSISYTTMHPQQTCLRVGVWWDMIRCKPFFVKNFERTCTYTALCERIFEVGPACGRCPRSTTFLQ